MSIFEEYANYSEERQLVKYANYLRGIWAQLFNYGTFNER
jgi:hypothetical protein